MDVLTSIDLPGVRKFKSGKVREVFDLGDSLLFVATDRLSAFDCILPTGIPWKGHVLNQLSAWWFARLGHLCPHHVIETDFRRYPDPLSAHARLLRGRSMIVRKTRVIPVECVARGYLIGSGWKEYEQAGAIGGMRLRPGYRLADRLDDPIFTPARKAESGHDENVSFEDVMRETSPSLARRLRETTLTLYREAAVYALSRGIILADTKFEFGLDGDELVLIDEVLTPDSSRFWPAAEVRVGANPPSFDKQFLRDYLERIGWNKQPPPPPIPAEIIEQTRARYAEAARRLAG
jgi:phosphoribosylaminoimidazole-succinocarboxamide synthase